MKKYIKYILLFLIIFILIALFIVLRNNNKKDTILKVEYEGNDIYYSDTYFKHSSTEYDNHLATLSMLFSRYSVSNNQPDDINDITWYQSQSNKLKGAYEVIGFNDFATNEDYVTRTTFDTVGIGVANKKLNNYTLIGVTIRSGQYYLEWGNNAWLGDGTKSDYMHEGWYNAANNLIEYLNKYINDSNISGKVKLWITGYSRGGAIANIAGGLLDNNLNLINNVSLNHDDLFIYTIETPQGASINSQTVLEPTNEIYNNIWNIINPNDIIPKLAMQEFGFTRFGQDIFIGKSNDKLNNTVSIVLSEISNVIETRERYNSVYQEEIRDIISSYMSDDINSYRVINELISQIRTIAIKALTSNKKNIIDTLSNSLNESNIKIISNLIIPLVSRLYTQLNNEDIQLLSNVFDYHDPNFILDTMKLYDTYYME